jgi:hypothetical protein
VNRKDYEVFSLGDKYFDMLFNKGLMPIITKATRVTDHTSIDHIGNMLKTDITDHCRFSALWPKRFQQQSKHNILETSLTLRHSGGKY